jgi:flagellar motor switch protein FliN/FliY
MAKESQPGEQASAIGPGSGETAAEAALVKAPVSIGGFGSFGMDSVFSRLPIEIDVAVPVRDFRVRNLLALEKGQVIESSWLQGEDLPLAGRGAQLAWSEFEVIDQKLAVRITRLV